MNIDKFLVSFGCSLTFYFFKEKLKQSKTETLVGGAKKKKPLGFYYSTYYFMSIN